MLKRQQSSLTQLAASVFGGPLNQEAKTKTLRRSKAKSELPATPASQIKKQETKISSTSKKRNLASILVKSETIEERDEEKNTPKAKKRLLALGDHGATTSSSSSTSNATPNPNVRTLFHYFSPKPTSQ